MVPISRLSCSAPAVKASGSNKTPSRRTPGVSRGRGRASAMPARRHAIIIIRNWAAPAAATPQTSAWPAACGVPDEDKQHADQDQVEQDRRGGRRDEAVERVQHAAEQRDQRHEQQIGEGDAREIDGEREFVGVVGETGRDDDHQPGHGDLDQNREDDQRTKQYGERLLGEGLGGAVALGLEAAREQRHEGGRQGALGGQPAEQVGEAEGDDEGLGDRPGAEHRGDQDVAHETQHAARHGVATDRGRETDQRHDRVISEFRGRRKAGTGALFGRVGLARRGAGLGEGVEQAAAQRGELALVGDLQAEDVLEVEDVDGALAVGRDMRRDDREREVGECLGDIVQQPRPVAAVDLDARVARARGIVDQGRAAPP